MEETLRLHLLELANRYCAATSTKLGPLGKRALNDNTLFVRLAAKEVGFNVRTYDRLIAWFSENWPEGAEWPAEVERQAA